MAEIVYEEREVEEELFTIDFPNDPIRRTEEELREEMLKYARGEAQRLGIDLGDESEIEFKVGEGVSTYEASDGDLGEIVQVVRKSKEKVPYKVEKEELLKIDFPNDPIRRTEEELREEMLKYARGEAQRLGIDLGDESQLEFAAGEGVSTYEASDGDLGETISVYRVTKTKLEEATLENNSNENVENKNSDLDKEIKELEELRDLRQQLQNATDAIDVQHLIDQIRDKVTNLESNVDDVKEMTNELETQIDEIDAQIKELKAQQKRGVAEYEKSYERMQKLNEEHNARLESSGLLTEEELQVLREEFERKKIEESEKSVEIKRQLQEQKKQITALTRQKNKIKNDVMRSEALGLSVAEYNDITNTLRKRKIVNAILETKGLGDIISKPSKERTKEEQELLKNAREEIIQEISAVKGADENLSVLEAIERIYNIEPVMSKGKEPRVLLIRKNDYQNITSAISLIPEKVKSSSERVANYVPGQTPIDMKEVVSKGEKSDDEYEWVEQFGGETYDYEDIYAAIQRDHGVDIRNNPDFRIGYGGANDDVYGPETHTSEYKVFKKVKKDTKADPEPEPTPIVIDDVLGKDTIDKFVILTDLDNNNEKYVRKAALDRFNISSDLEVEIDRQKFARISPEDAQHIIDNQGNDYSPYAVEERDVNLGRRKPEDEEVEIGKDTVDKFVILTDLDNNNEKYVRKAALDRFNIPSDLEVEIEGQKFARISQEDAQHIIDNQDNDYSPYVVEERDVNLGLRKPEDEEVEIGKDTVDKFVILTDLDNNNEKYVRKAALERFNISSDLEVEIEGQKFARISPEDAQHIIDNQDNDYSPYVVEERDVHLGTRKGPVPPVPSEEDIFLYRDLNDNGQVYASGEVLGRFGISPSGDAQVIEGNICYKISSDTDQMINYIADKSSDPKLNVKYIDVNLKKKEKPHVEAIIQKLTKELDIRAKDSKRYTASNIKVSRNFVNELQSGNWVYNVVHLAPAVAKASISFFKKLSGKIMTSRRAKETMEEITRRADEDLTEEELEVLFEEYKGSQLKTDMNNQINSVILDRLRRYGLEKVEKLNETIKVSYANLFSLLGQIKAIDEQLNSGKIGEAEFESLNAERKELMSKASGFVKTIIDSRKEANNLLSSGVHGLEEDFKAVSTKLSYVGMRFAKKNDFDNELQEKLAEYGQELNAALAEGDQEKIVDSFMSLETCYYDNTKIRGSLVGKRSVGSKYYSPLAEQFDYRDDPFIRDLFTTVAITSAAVSAVNAFRVHQIEDAEVLRRQQEEAARVNQNNDSIMDQVSQTGRDIQGRRGTFQEGMEAQAHQDVLNSANALERESLDMHGWSFGDAYHATDAANHSFYNSFHQDVTSQVNDVASRYGSGAITQAQALQEMANIASSSQNALTQVCRECLDVLRPYAQSHSQFDLSAIEESMEYIISHPDAIANMNQGMVDVTSMAGGLVGLSANHVHALSSLPSDMLSTMVCAASAAGLAMKVSNDMKGKYGKAKYGNEVTEMMKDYLRQEEAEEKEYEESISHGI